MSDKNTTQSNQSSFQNSGTGGGQFRDVNASMGGLEASIELGNKSSATSSGAITVGDFIAGDKPTIGLVKSILLGCVVLGSIWLIYRK